MYAYTCNIDTHTHPHQFQSVAIENKYNISQLVVNSMCNAITQKKTHTHRDCRLQLVPEHRQRLQHRVIDHQHLIDAIGRQLVVALPRHRAVYGERREFGRLRLQLQALPLQRRAERQQITMS